MFQFECPRVIHPFLSFTFESTVGCPFLCMQKREMLHVAYLKSEDLFC